MGWFKNLGEKRRLKKEFAIKQAEAEVLRIEDLKKVHEAPRLHGYNLKEWNYLGYTEISIAYSDAGYKEVCQVFFFMDKEDEDVRQYVLKSKALHKDFKNHAWVTRNADLWAAAEIEWYQPISDNPSRYTRARILEEFNSVWSNEKKWWVSNDAAKYEAAKQKQKKQETEEEEKVVAVEDNVLTVNFKKDEEPTT